MAKKGRRSTYEERVQMVLAIEAGESPDKVAVIFGVGRQSVFRYWRDYRAMGLAGLRTKKTRGPESKLTGEQKRKLYALIVGANPRQLSFDFGLWTRRLVRDLIRREFNVLQRVHDLTISETPSLAAFCHEVFQLGRAQFLGHEFLTFRIAD